MILWHFLFSQTNKKKKKKKNSRQDLAGGPLVANTCCRGI